MSEKAAKEREWDEFLRKHKAEGYNNKQVLVFWKKRKAERAAAGITPPLSREGSGISRNGSFNLTPSTSMNGGERSATPDLSSVASSLSIHSNGSDTPPPSTHPLQNSWSLFYDNPGKRVSQTSWADSIRLLSTYTFVEDFWRLHNNVVPPSKLLPGSNYHLFKTGIEPAWEDPANAQGGKWVITVPKQSRAMVDELWLNLILLMIGEMSEFADEICGAVVSMRNSQDRICLWTKTARSEHVQCSIGRQVREALNLPPAWPLGYQAHADAQKHNSSFNSKSRYEC